MLNIVIWLVVGAAIGWVAGLLMRNEDDDAVFTNVVVGIAGALAAAWLAAPEVGVHALSPRVFGLGALAVSLLGAVGLGALAVSLLGAVGLLALVAAVRHVRARPRA